MTEERLLVAVVDDDASVRKALSRLLSAAGFQVESHAGGAPFLESLASHLPHCVIVDLHMPNMNGLDLQARIVASGLHVPVIVITADDEPSLREQALAAGAARYLTKPFSDEVLLSAVAAADGVLERGLNGQ